MKKAINSLPYSSRIKTSAFVLISSLLINAWGTTANAQDYEREAKHAAGIEQMLIVGDTLPLQTEAEPDHVSVNLLTEADLSLADGHASIIVHGTGIHPNWPDLVHPLRSMLADNGITTLALQMPVAAMQADPEAYVPLFPLATARIHAGLDWLEQNGYENITIIGHSLGATMVTIALNQIEDSHPSVQGVVLIGMAGLKQADVDSISGLEALELPMLDVQGGEDLDEVLKVSEERQRLGSVRGEFTQETIADANHMFSNPGNMDALVDFIVEWIRR